MRLTEIEVIGNIPTASAIRERTIIDRGGFTLRANAVIVAAALAAGVFATPAAADVLPDRAQAVSLLETGGPGVARA
ncbi:hypothetical protein ABT262_38940, partial [Amycolatopsis mediterranei]